MYILAQNGSVSKYPYSVADLRKDNPNTAFPKQPDLDILRAWGVFPVVRTDSPAFNEVTQNLQEVEPTLVGGEWRQVWVVVEASSEEVAQRTLQKAEDIRSLRNTLLAASDWTQVADAPVDGAAWATYRQVLRDITSQPGFPLSVDWPSQPISQSGK